MKHGKLGSLIALALAMPAALQASPAIAKVAQVDERGFVVRHVAEVPVAPAEAWAVLVKPAAWWDSRHTWSADSANLSLDARPGGCFCEALPDKSSAKAGPRGGVEHMRVVYIEKPRALRMVGALGPLQADAVTGTLTIQFKPVGGDGDGAESARTQILLEYVVGGYLRTPPAEMAPAVDAVLGGQVAHLVEKLGGAFDQAFPSPGIVGADKAQAAPPNGIEPLAPEAPTAQDGEPVGR